MAEKESAFSFLLSLEEFLNKSIPDPHEVLKKIHEIVEKAKTSNDKRERHLKRPEEAFLNEYVAPVIHNFLSINLGLGMEGARKAFLSENYRCIPKLASDSPRRSKKPPFIKKLCTKETIIKKWEGPGPVVERPCPDMALRSPCPYKIVIEGKYFSSGGIQAAKSELAINIYQAFFYRALPYLPETSKHPAWDYDYACFLAYDSTEEGSLKKAWDLLDRRVRESCWEGANIYVMILRGQK